MFICQHCGGTITPDTTIGGRLIWKAATDGAWTAPLDCIAVGGLRDHRPALTR